MIYSFCVSNDLTRLQLLNRLFCWLIHHSNFLDRIQILVSGVNTNDILTQNSSFVGLLFQRA